MRVGVSERASAPPTASECGNGALSHEVTQSVRVGYLFISLSVRALAASQPTLSVQGDAKLTLLCDATFLFEGIGSSVLFSAFMELKMLLYMYVILPNSVSFWCVLNV